MTDRGKKYSVQIGVLWDVNVTGVGKYYCVHIGVLWDVNCYRRWELIFSKFWSVVGC